MTTSVNSINNDYSEFNYSRTELDSHANMAVLGKHCTIVSKTGKTANVKPFSPDCNTLDEVPIVDALIKWRDPHTDEMYLQMHCMSHQ